MKTIEQFNEMIQTLPVLLSKLQSSPTIDRENLQGIPICGIYVFYENQEPIYVGRSDRLKQRLLEHGQPSSVPNSATFAFNLAKDKAETKGFDNPVFTRATVQIIPEHRDLFLEAKRRVAAMKLRVVEVVGSVDQTVFEVYAALALKTTRYNSFENH